MENKLYLFLFFVGGKEIYTSEKTGSDSTGDGSKAKPFKTVLQALREAKNNPATIYVDSKEEGQVSRCKNMAFHDKMLSVIHILIRVNSFCFSLIAI